MKTQMKRIIALVLLLLIAAVPAMEQMHGGAARGEQTLEATPPPTLKLGDNSQDVKDMKVRLYELGYFKSNDFNTKFTQNTEDVLKRFQRLNGMEPTGELTPDVREALYAQTAKRYEVTPTPSPEPTPTLKPLPTPAPMPELVYPDRDAEGYLAGEGEFVYEDDEAGVWVYLTANLQITIQRQQDETIPLEWFETHIYLRGDEKLLTVENNPERPGTKFSYPDVIASNNQFVLAFTDDFYGHRMYQKEKVGIVIRDGEILSDKTYNKQLHNLPNLDIMAQFADGSLKAYGCAEKTAEELLAMGAINVFCFGPVLIKDGEINEIVLEKWYETKSPRQALGMIEPGHYLLLSVQGRMKSSQGTGLIRMAQMMKERGVTEALNLDGGNTMALIFRGTMINKLATWKNRKFVRTVSSMIGVGQSEYEIEDEE